jgi:hypothetical protein
MGWIIMKHPISSPLEYFELSFTVCGYITSEGNKFVLPSVLQSTDNKQPAITGNNE